MKIIFTGLPYFAHKIVSDLDNYDSRNQYYFFNTYYNVKDKLKYLLHLRSADLVISFNGAYSNSKALNAAIKLDKKIMMQWHGTDVLNAVDLHKKKALNRKYIDYSQSFTDAEWLQQELKDINVDARVLHFKYVDEHSVVSHFESTDALCYVAEGREKFYGIEKILQLAGAFRQTHFHIVGTAGKNIKVTPNIHFYGWVSKEKLRQMRNTSAIFIRLAQHDGFSLSVLEALNNGNEVIWNYPQECCNYVSSLQSLIDSFGVLQDKIKSNGLKPNQKNIDWVRSHFLKQKILSNYHKKLMDIVEG